MAGCRFILLSVFIFQVALIEAAVRPNRPTEAPVIIKDPAEETHPVHKLTTPPPPPPLPEYPDLTKIPPRLTFEMADDDKRMPKVKDMASKEEIISEGGNFYDKNFKDQATSFRKLVNFGGTVFKKFKVPFSIIV